MRVLPENNRIKLKAVKYDIYVNILKSSPPDPLKRDPLTRGLSAYALIVHFIVCILA